jgi:hypothetical protein
MDRILLLARTLRGCLALLACCAVWMTLPSAPATAQSEEKPSVFLSTDRQQGTNPLVEDLMFRPNADGEVFLWVKNPAPDAKTFLLVIKNGDEELARKEFSVPAKKQIRQPLDKLKNAPPETKKEEPPPDPKKPDDKKTEDKKPEPPAKIDLPEIKGDAPKLVFQLFEIRNEKDSTGKFVPTPTKEPVAVRTMRLRIMQPREYLQATASYDANQRLTTVTIKAAPNFGGAVCPVSLSFRPDLLPGLDEKSVSSGVFRQSIDQPGKEVRLVAERIAFDKNPLITKIGQIAVHADGVDRAFLFKADYDISSGSRAFNEVREPAIRIRGTQPDGEGKIRLLSQPVPKLRIPVEVDNAPEGARIEIGIDRDKNGVFDEDEVLTLPAARDQHIYFNPYGPDGGLAFKTTVRDWAPDMDTKDVLADHDFRARILSRANQDLNPPVQVNGKVWFDNTPPEAITFGEFPKVLAKGQKMPVSVTASDVESNVVKVNFYLAELKEGKLADGLPAIPARRGKDGAWIAEVPVPEKKGDFTIVAQVFNGVGLVAVADTKVEVAEPAPPTGNIKGKIVDNGRPQPQLEVTLRAKNPKDPKDPTKKEESFTTTTDDKGAYTFEKVPPGEYVVSAVSKSIKTHVAKKTIDVKPDKTVDADLNLAP